MMFLWTTSQPPLLPKNCWKTNSSDFKHKNNLDRDKICLEEEKKKQTVNNIFIHFVSFTLEMKKKSLVMFSFLFFFFNDCVCMRLLWVSSLRVESCSLLVHCWGRDFPDRVENNPPNFSLKNSFHRKNFLTPIDIVYSHRGPAIASDEINETARRGWRENIKGEEESKKKRL